MDRLKCLVYDGTFEGLLSCVNIALNYKEEIGISSDSSKQGLLFMDNHIVKTDKLMAMNLWKLIKSRSSRGTHFKIFYAFLSEDFKIEELLFRYIKYILSSGYGADRDYSNPTVLKIAQIAKKVGREKHRMEAFVRFRLTKDEIYFAVIEPDFNVLPILIKHFKSRYADQKWVIFDKKRHYGIYYDLESVSFITMEFCTSIDIGKTSEEVFANSEIEFQHLWQDYFNSTNIGSRKNMKLHIRHVPKRYWKYLTEKQLD